MKCSFITIKWKNVVHKYGCTNLSRHFFVLRKWHIEKKVVWRYGQTLVLTIIRISRGLLVTPLGGSEVQISF